jgi:MFS transporter, SP family, solute carrier family 2 (myo-inositol transporter), member 13
MGCATANCNQASTDPGGVSSTGRGSPFYLLFMVLVAGMGGLLAGIDYGIIAGALLYLDKTIPMTLAQEGFMVSIYIFGGVIAALFAGTLADFTGRKKMMIVGGVMFVASILLIFVSAGYAALLTGRILMGLSGGVVCVVVPLYMAECLPAHFRGRGTSAFQLLMTLGFVLAAFIATYFSDLHEAAVKAAAGNSELIFAADDSAWRHIFLTACIPGILFTIGALLLKESPRWLFRRNRAAEAEAILLLSRPADQARLEIREMRERSGLSADGQKTSASVGDSLLQRKYVVPFVIACVVLACTQATGINSILSYAAKILQGTGLTEKQAAFNLQIITGINCVVTLLGALLVDKLGRKILLSVGTAGIIVCLTAAGVLFNSFESKRVDVLEQVRKGISADGLSLVVRAAASIAPGLADAPSQLSVTYKYEQETKPHIATAFSNAAEESARHLKVEPESEKKWATVDGQKVEQTRVKDCGKLEILRASYGPIASPDTGKWVTVLLCAFIGFFAVGPGVCVWLALTELMPTRIRSTGIGVAMVLNNGVQFLSALFFPIVVGTQGFHVMFFIWAGCTVVYFITAAFFMPETKGKTLEEIEDYFEGKKKTPLTS